MRRAHHDLALTFTVMPLIWSWAKNCALTAQNGLVVFDLDLRWATGRLP